MTLPVPLRIAARELRGGLKGFRVFLACLALGVAAIAAVGSVRESISAGLEREGASILGGDAAITLTYRFAEEAERAWLDANAGAVSEIVDFRSMAVVPRGDEAERGLTQVKGVDAAYPLYGALVLDPPMTAAEAFAGQGGLPGAVMDPILISRLGLEVGQTFRLGTQDFVLVAAILREPDAAEGGFGLGPRTMVLTADLSQSGLLQPGTLFDSQYRLRLPPETDLDAFRAEAEEAFAPGTRWRDRRNGAPGVSEFVDRLGAFLVLVGLAGLAVGGVGVSAAVRSYLEEKTPVIATLKTLGAESRTIFLTYFAQIGVLTLLGIAIGLVLGAVLPLALAPVIEARLPVPCRVRLPRGAAARGGALRPARGAPLHALAARAHRRGAGRGAFPRHRGPRADDAATGLAADDGGDLRRAGRAGGRVHRPHAPDALVGGGAGGGLPPPRSCRARGAVARRSCRPVEGAPGPDDPAAGARVRRRSGGRGAVGRPVAGAWPDGAGGGRPDRLEPARRDRARPARGGAVLLRRRHPERPDGGIPRPAWRQPRR